MNALELGTKLVTMVNAGQEREFTQTHYADDVVSIEGQGSDEMPARLQGIAAVKGKAEWWYENNDVHAMTAEGPYVGLAEDQFVVRFTMDVTPKGGERMQMDELGLYTVRDGRVAQEAFLYRMG